MNIIACVKRVPTTDAEVRFKADSSGLDTDGLPYMISFYDEIALEQAVLTKEALGGEVTALSLGPASGSKEIRECLAKGADKAVILTDDAWMSCDCRATAKRLAAANVNTYIYARGRTAGMETTRNLHLGINAVVFALTQEGSMTQRLMQMVE